MIKADNNNLHVLFLWSSLARIRNSQQNTVAPVETTLKFSRRFPLHASVNNIFVVRDLSLHPDIVFPARIFFLIYFYQYSADKS